MYETCFLSSRVSTAENQWSGKTKTPNTCWIEIRSSVATNSTGARLLFSVISGKIILISHYSGHNVSILLFVTYLQNVAIIGDCSELFFPGIIENRTFSYDCTRTQTLQICSMLCVAALLHLHLQSVHVQSLVVCSHYYYRRQSQQATIFPKTAQESGGTSPTTSAFLCHSNSPCSQILRRSLALCHHSITG